MILKKITFRNILSYGNNDTVFEFGDIYNHETIGIIGKNGNGKTSIFDALFYGLYNKPYRKVNLSDLVNRDNNSDMYVSVEFVANGHEYMIERGMSSKAKSKLIKIWVDGKEENLDAHSKDIQKYIETQIIGVNEKIFRLIFMIGLGSFASFFEHSLPERRAILEFIVGINVLSVMLKKIKKIHSTDTANYEKLKLKVEQLIETRDLYKQKITDMESIQKTTDYTKDIKKLEREINIITKELEKINKDELEKDIKNIQIEINKIEKDLKEWISELKENEVFLKQNIELISFFDENDVCPTCTQSITDGFKKEKVENLKHENNDLIKENKKINSKIEEFNITKEKEEKKISDLDDKIFKLKELQRDLKHNNENYVTYKEKQRQITEDSDRIISDIQTKLTEKRLEIKKIVKDGKNIARSLEVNGVIVEILGDNGIKKYIYDIILRQINKYINEYICEFNFNKKLKIKSDLSEMFYHRIGDNIQYASFSNGEKLIVNFSFIFGMLRFIEEFYGFKSNFLFFDEILDTSLDVDNKTFLLDNLKKFDKNIIIISHDFTLSSLFNRCYVVTKEDDFSTITLHNM